MRVLGIETSGEEAGIALVDDSGLVAEEQFRHEMQLSQCLHPRLEGLLRTAGWKPADLDGVAASIGPGSFTGLRIGVAAAKALAFALDRPALPVPTLEALAVENPVPPELLVCAMVPASQNDLFAALYQWNGGRLEPRAQELMLPARDLARKLSQTPLRVAFLGRVGTHRALFTEALEGRALFASERLEPLASTVAGFGLRLLNEGRGVSPHELAPRYLRPSAAEARRQEAACPSP